MLADRRMYEKTLYSNKLYINVGDLISFDENYGQYEKDYFPANQIYAHNITDTIMDINLLKEKTSKILAVQVYTDLMGANSNSPNGLIQVDFSKRLNLLTWRRDLKTWNIGLINYFSPEFTLSKIESSGKYLIPNYYGSNPKPNTNKPNVFATSTDLLLYQQYRVGGKLDVVLFDVPEIKSNITISTGFHYGRTLIQDTLRSRNSDTAKVTFIPRTGNNLVQYGVNSFQVVPEICWEIYPDSRYTVIFTQQFNNYTLLSTQVRQVDATDRYQAYLKTGAADITKYSFSRWVASSEVKGVFKPSDNNELFFRYRFNWDMNNSHNNFNQIQLGVTTYLTSTVKSTKKTQLY